MNNLDQSSFLTTIIWLSLNEIGQPLLIKSVKITDTVYLEVQTQQYYPRLH